MTVPPYNESRPGSDAGQGIAKRLHQADRIRELPLMQPTGVMDCGPDANHPLERARAGQDPNAYPRQDITMLHTSPRSHLRSLSVSGLLTALMLLTACAQQQPGGHEIPTESTLSDARQHAQGRNRARAASQLQFGYGEQAHAADEGARLDEGTAITAAGAGATALRPLKEARTFLGTLPCADPGGDCPATRLTLTLAPAGEWRSRTEIIDTRPSGQTLTAHGCWDIISTEPLRIVLRNTNETSHAQLRFVNDNVLRIGEYNGITPVLDHHLTRQADLDPIPELDEQPALRCR